MPLPAPGRHALLGALLLCCIARAAGAQDVPGRWELTDYDPTHQTGTSQIALWLQADQRILNPHPVDPHNVRALPLLSIQCQGGQSEFFINLNFEADRGPVDVSYSLDGGPAMDATWQVRDSGVSVAPEDRVDFVRSLLGRRRLDLTLTVARAEPTSTGFDIAGIEAALEKLRPSCPW
jgi:hypothetical protein